MPKKIKYVHLTQEHIDKLLSDYYIISEAEYKAIQDLNRHPIKTNLKEYLDRISKFSKNPEQFKRKFVNPNEISAANTRDLAGYNFVVNERFQIHEEKWLKKITEKELVMYFSNIKLIVERRFDLIPEAARFHLLEDKRGVVEIEDKREYKFTDLHGYASIRVKDDPQEQKGKSSNTILLLVRVIENLPIGFAYIGKHNDTYSRKPEFFKWIAPQLNKKDIENEF